MNGVRQRQRGDYDVPVLAEPLFPGRLVPQGPAALLSNQAPVDDPELKQVQADWEKAVETAVAGWAPVTAGMRQELRTQVAQAVQAGDVAQLAQMSVSPAAGEGVLSGALGGLWDVSGARMAAELHAQGAPLVVPPAADAALLAGDARASSSLLSAGYAAVAARAAVAAYRPGVPVAEVLAAVDEALDGLSEASLRGQIGGALSRAQNQARLLTGRQLELDLGGSPGDPNNPVQPPAAGDDYVPQVFYRSSEINDKNTCWPCHQVDGTEYERWIDAWVDYGGGIYRGCLGRDRCRGTVKARWNPAAGS